MIKASKGFVQELWQGDYHYFHMKKAQLINWQRLKVLDTIC